VDYEAGLIKLAEVRQNAVTPSPVRFPSAVAGCGDSKLSTGAIAAIVLGVVVGLALLIGAAYYLRRRRRNQPVQPSLETQQLHPPSEPQPPMVEDHTTMGTPLVRSEVSSEGRTYELPSPNGGHPLPSPRAASQPLHTVASSSSKGPEIPRASITSPISPPIHANNPWNT